MDGPIIVPKSLLYRYQVTSYDGDTYKFCAEFFKHDAGGFAFYIGKQKVAWFDYKIVKAICTIYTEENTNDHRNYKKRGGYSDGDQGLE